MATPPTRVTYVTPTIGYGSATSPKTTPTFDVVAGDLITLIASTEDGATTISAPTTTGNITWTLRQSVAVTSYCTMYAYTGVVNATATGITVSVARAGTTTNYFSFGVTVWRNHGGVGVSGKANASGAPSLALVCSANSALVTGSDDWNATDGTTRAWRTVNGSAISESLYSFLTGHFTVYSGYVADAGAAATQTLGLTLPSTQKYSVVGVEVLGTAGGSAFSGSLALSGAGVLTGSGKPAASSGGALSGSGALATTGSPTISGAAAFSGSGSLTLSGAPTTSASLALSGGGSLAPSGTLAASGGLTASGSGVLTLAGKPTATGPLAASGSGSLALSGASSQPGSGSLALAGAGTLTLTGKAATGGTLTLASAGTLALSGAATGANALAGTLALSGAGGLTLTGRPTSGGVLVLAGAGALTLAGVNGGPTVDLRILSSSLHVRTFSGTLHTHAAAGVLTTATAQGTLHANAEGAIP